MQKNNRVLLSMSGGIDSTVAAILLKRQGFDIVGVTYRTWDTISEGCMEKEKGCCTINAIMEAKRMATQMGFPHHFLDIRHKFRQSVIQNFIDEYLSGHTPNPCVVCNAEIKWGEVLRMADEMDCYYIATGHYAQIVNNDGKYYLRRGYDRLKDQTYFLWKLPQNVLSRTIFPLGELHKTEVRRIAFDAGFEKLSKKAESQEICFIEDDNYRHFLEKEVGNYSEYCREGNFVDSKGNILGKHRGYPNYTIGQRKGLGIALGKPAFVSQIRPSTNEVVLAERDSLLQKTLYAKDCVFVSASDFDGNATVEARIRYKTPASKAMVTLLGGDRVRVDFAEDVWAVASGQSIVFYRDDILLGGGVIE